MNSPKHSQLGQHPQDYLPKLWKWYCNKITDRTTVPYESLLWGLTKGLANPGRAGTIAWINCVEEFQRNSQNKLEDFLLADSLSVELGSPVTDILSTLCEIAIKCGEGKKVQNQLIIISSQTNLSVLRFLAAWVSLNIGDLDGCIEECEKEVEPHAPIYTLLGQALLERGRVDEAVDALKVAVKLDPTDILAHVQLIKSCLVSEKAVEAIPSIERCRKLVGENIEIECLAAMIVIASQKNKSTQVAAFSEFTLNKLVTLFESEPSNLDLLTLAFDVSDACDNQDAAGNIMRVADVAHLARRPDFLGKVAKLLRKLGEKRWFSVSQILTDKLSPIFGPMNVI